MTGKERFLATVERKKVDYPAKWLGLPVPAEEKRLEKYFNVQNPEELKRVIDDDVWAIEMPFHSPRGNAIYNAFNFAEQSEIREEERTLTTPGFFADVDSPDEVDSFPWYDPEPYIDVQQCKALCERAPADKAVVGILWSAHFQDTCAAFGMENALVNMLVNPEVYLKVNDKIVEFYLKANRIFYEATKGHLNGVLIGNDMGSQLAPMISPELVRKFVIPGAKKLIAQAKEYGLKVIYHSCGAIFDIIPDLIEAGADVIHPIQALAAGMQPERLKKAYENQVSFCGGVDTQQLLVHGSKEEIREKVLELKQLFPTGLILSPSHEALQEDIAPSHVETMMNAVKEM